MMEYVTISAGAGILKVSRPTVYKFISEGKLGVYTVLGRPALKLNEVNRVARKRARKAKKSNGNGHG
jgi:excisionase family DNA binding protein